jgi:hypothetical protein
MARRLLAFGLALAVFGCASPRATPEERAPAPTSAASKARVRELRARENARRSDYDPATAPAWIDVSGADPYRIVQSGAGFVGALRGSRALVRLDENLRELSRVALPEAPTALCVSPAGDAWVGSRYGRKLLHVSANFRDVAVRPLDAAGVADLACGERGLLYVLPADGSELLTLSATGAVLNRRPALAGGLRLQRRGRYLLESSLFERSLRVLELSRRGLPQRELARIRHDGTLWAFDAKERGDQLWIAVAGVEDKPLVRAHGEFENIDSFVWVYRLENGALRELAALNASDQGLVVPKAVQLSLREEGVALSLLASGSGRLLRALWGTELDGEPRVETQPALPGVSDAVFSDDGTVAYASPLFDAWVKLTEAGAQLTRVEPERRPEVAARLGEALFFTELMAPENSSRATHSRFSCETCHLEGGVDGRVHYTGRADVSVVTKPLFGLANNRPHFSRAMDPDLSSVCHNEFRVAGAGSGTDPWFSLEASRFPWLHELGVDSASLGPLELRAALLDFLYTFAHSPNPLAQAREHFSSLEAEGARAFADHCQSCHAPRLLSDDPASAQPFAAWERLVLSRNAPLVWARADYEKTGVLPYVHERGTRTTSLRRLALKPRYFTNGSGADLPSVLARFRDGPGGSWHDSAPADARLVPLAPETRRALLAFLRLL